MEDEQRLAAAPQPEVVAVGPASWFSVIARELPKNGVAFFVTADHDAVLNRVADTENRAVAMIVKQNLGTLELGHQVELLRSSMGWQTVLPKIAIYQREEAISPPMKAVFTRSGFVAYIARHEIETKLWPTLRQFLSAADDPLRGLTDELPAAG